MGRSPFHAAILAVTRPLEFAAKDDFAHADRVQGLEATVAAAARAAAALAIPRDAAQALAQVQARFEAVSGPEDRVAAVKKARERLAAFADPVFPRKALARSPAALPGVGPKRADVLARRGLASVADLLFHLPRGYDDRRALSKIADLLVGRRATFIARVVVCDFVPQRVRGRFRRMFQAVVGDDTGTVTLKWFHGGETIASSVRKDALLLVTGEVKRYRFSLDLVHPEVEVLSEEGDGEGSPGVGGLERLVPEYPTPEGIHPRALRQLVARAVEQYADLCEGQLPDRLVAERSLPEPADALRALHAPAGDADVAALRERRSPAFERLVLEELYLLELGLALRRARQAREVGIAVPCDGPGARTAPERLPFRLTAAQTRVWDEVRADLERPHPMNRLLEGDVGSGKTVIAWLAAVALAESGHQTAIMAPTELLAEQHARTIAELAAGASDASRLRTALLTASVPRADAREIRRALAAGEVDLVIGTHALLQEGVAFARLALVVIDEQHRFGVRQRAALAGKTAADAAPHTLVMTATPIPRTLALTVYGDLDLSVIDELPPGRSPVRTILLRSSESRRVMDLLRETVARGEQVYVVYPLVEESEKTDLRAARESADKIAAAFPDLRVDLVHGRLDAAERGASMERFRRGDTEILVSTTVIEVGVDVANATLMVVEHAERFGLAQLHQLRGRVGRGAKPGTCVLVARGGGEDSEARLSALLETTDGFDIAEADLRIRGPGEFLGTRQSGRLPDLRIADLVRDARHVARAREAALETVRRDPDLARSPHLLDAVRLRWADRLALADIA